MKHCKTNRFLTRRKDHYLGLAPENADLHVEAAKAEAAAANAAAGSDGLLSRSLVRTPGAFSEKDLSQQGLTTMPMSDDGEILMVKIHALEEVENYSVTFWEHRLGLRVTKTLPLTVIGFTDPPPGRPAFEAEAKGCIMVGDTVTSIDGRSIEGLTRTEVFSLLNNLKRPVVLGMSTWRGGGYTKNTNKNTYSKKANNLLFKNRLLRNTFRRATTRGQLNVASIDEGDYKNNTKKNNKYNNQRTLE